MYEDSEEDANGHEVYEQSKVIFKEDQKLICDKCGLQIETREEYIYCSNEECGNAIINHKCDQIESICDISGLKNMIITNSIEEVKYDKSRISKEYHDILDYSSLYCISFKIEEENKYIILHIMIDEEPNELSSSVHDNIYNTFFIFNEEGYRDEYFRYVTNVLEESIICQFSRNG